MKYLYPAIFEYDSRADVYFVSIPNILEGYYTAGKTIEIAEEQAKEKLTSMLQHFEDMSDEIPMAADWRSIQKLSAPTVVRLLEVWTK